MKHTKFKLKTIIIFILFLVVIFSMRMVWYLNNSPLEQPIAVKGVLDMRGWDFENSRSIVLDGEWEFYPEQLLDRVDTTSLQPPSYLQVPGDWQSSFSDPKTTSSYGYGTYRLRILIDQPLEQPYGFWIKKIQSSSKLIINGKPEKPFGVLAELPENYKPRVTSYTASHQANNQGIIELIVQAANFDNPSNGGIVKSINFGSQAAIDSERMYSIGFQLFTFAIMLLHSLYAVILYLFNRRYKALAIFALLLLCVGISIVSDHDSLLQIWLPVNFTWAIKIKLLSYISLTYFMMLLAESFMPSPKISRIFQAISLVVALYSVYLLLAPMHSIFRVLGLFTLLYLLPVIRVLYLFIKLMRQKKQDALFLLLAASSVTSSVAWGVLQSRGLIASTFYPFDMIAAIVVFSSYWFKRYFRNAQENTKLNEQLRLADKKKDEFLANTSHELRTPLHGIINIAQTIASNEQESLSPKSNHDLNLLLTISRRMSHLLNDLLDMVRLQDNQIRLYREKLHIQSAASGVMDMLGYMTRGKPLQLQVDIPEVFPAVVADEKRLVQILFNLVHNAIKYTEAGVVSITAESRGEFAFIHVSDTGAGMDSETGARIMRRYEQGANGLSDGGGIGLGLSICKELVELHGGELTVQSSPGAGSTFTFTLPLYDPASFPNEPASPEEGSQNLSAMPILEYVADAAALSVVLENQQLAQPAPEGHLNILAVDDDPVNLEVLASILSAEPYHLVPALSGKEALTLLGSRQWDLVIADVMMPQMSGYELTRKIRERFAISELPILLLTARSQYEDIYNGFQSGANDYIIKPVDALELKYRVWSLTKLKQSVDERLRMEAAYLQAQIQPHFLFNTLNSLMALSELDTQRMRKLGEAFSSYLRISFNFANLEQLVPLTHELELIEAYLYIEKERFEERLTVQWEVEHHLHLRLPPLTIQPLVENAVRHGLLSRAKGGILLIRISQSNGSTLFEIIDNGKGMSTEQVADILNPSPEKGIGLLNTDRRLRQLYGNGLVIQSEPGEGTTVSFAIPDHKR
ncbi:hypothetical protein GCM10010912_38370 [Paenibacillus albidus]|uniref:histidine kinase n=1 Tax=Paenibacillus albidus TaxID=2041023 RepID=A0A917CIF6_9BACL|nr:ATP-binding protein [Paenibacillus albidus]GGF89564.1 hypothetical protein GCM10010912_38370 [Paenibacillus albidus]